LATVNIDIIEVDAEGRLLIAPPAGSDYTHVYRNATGVFWTHDGIYLSSPTPRDWTLLQWFECIYSSVRSEYGDTLEISQRTRWVNVPSELREQIIQSAVDIEDRLRMMASENQEISEQAARENEYRRISIDAAKAFQRRNYSETVRLLSSAPPPLSPSDVKKLAYSRKHVT